MSKFLVRVRHSKGTTRFELSNKSSTTIQQLKQLISEQLSDHPTISTQQLTVNGKSTDIALRNNLTMSSLKITHGHMFYLKIITSAILCQSTNANTNQNPRKRKFNEMNTETNTQNTSPQKKRTRLNHSNSNSNSNNTNSSLCIHTLSNTQNNTTNSNNSNNSNTSHPTAANRIDVRKKPIKKKACKKKAKKKKNEILVIKSEGDTIHAIVNNYFSDTNQLHIALKLLPNETQQKYTQQARIEAIVDDKVEITEYLEQSRFSSKAKSRGKRHLIVVYSFKRKKRKEIVCFYNDETIQQIITNLLWKSVHQNERENVFIKKKINEQNIIELVKRNKLTLNEIANRSPPLLWSLFHSFPNQQIENVLQKFVKVALKELRIKTRELHNNDNQ